MREVSVKIIMDVVGDIDGINRSDNGDDDHDHH